MTSLALNVLSFRWLERKCKEQCWHVRREISMTHRNWKFTPPPPPKNSLCVVCETRCLRWFAVVQVAVEYVETEEAHLRSNDVPATDRRRRWFAAAVVTVRRMDGRRCSRWSAVAAADRRRLSVVQLLLLDAITTRHLASLRGRGRAEGRSPSSSSPALSFALHTAQFLEMMLPLDSHMKTFNVLEN